MTTKEILKRAKAAKKDIALLSAEQKNEALLAMADSLVAYTNDILEANAKDVENAKDKISPVMIDRLVLSRERISAMAKGIREVALLEDPVGKVISVHSRPNGIHIAKISTAIGVIAIIYESRPNVTSDAAALSIKSGNVCVLRSGKEAWESANAIVCAMRKGLESIGITPDLVNLVEDRTRESANELMSALGYIDLLIPRGGAGLIRACVENAKVPCIETGTGICHIYVDESADIAKALDIIDNAKTSRPSVCNAAEVCLVNKEIAPVFLPLLEERLCGASRVHPVEIRADSTSRNYLKNAIPACDADYDTEFLDYILAVKTVDGINEACAHISEHSTHHSDAIITENDDNARFFVASVDSAAVYVNASTRFTDGGEFGLGCEMGISTQKLHARGPMGLAELTTYKYVIRGNGQIR